MRETPITGREAGMLRQIREGATERRALRAELDSLRGGVQAATDLVRSAQGSNFFQGWDPGIVSVRDLAAALGIEPNGPPPPPTEAELQEMRDMLADVRSDRAALAAAADAPQPADPPTPGEWPTRRTVEAMLRQLDADRAQSAYWRRRFAEQDSDQGIEAWLQSLYDWLPDEPAAAAVSS